MREMHCLNLTVRALAVLFFLSGCTTMKALGFRKSEFSGVKKEQHVRLFYLQGNKWADRLQLKAKTDKNEVTPLKGLDIQIKDCQKKTIVPLFAIPLIAAGGQVVFQYLTDALATNVKKLQEQAQREYNGRVTVDFPIFSKGDQCLLLVRFGDGKVEKDKDNITTLVMNDVGMALLLRTKDKGAGVTFTLSYLWVANAMAITEKAEPARIDLSLAVSVKSFDKVHGETSLRSLGEHTLMVPGLKLGGKEPAIDCSENCVLQTGLFAKPRDREEKGASFSVGVVETGSPASIGDRADAEIKALRKALGPALSKSITTVLTPSK